MANQNLMQRLMAKRKEYVERWLPQLAAKLGRSEEELLTQGLRCDDFPYEGVRIEFEDGSVVQFQYAFALEAPSEGFAVRPVAVFTEHCGYHEFCLMNETKVGVAVTSEE